MDAIRISDGKPVFLKRVNKSEHPFEIDIGLFFFSKPFASDPRNHCVPFLEVIPLPEDDNMAIIVMPFLRNFDSPDFDTVGEVVEFVRQMVEVSCPLGNHGFNLSLSPSGRTIHA
jgi:hypothetical protein